MIIINMVMTPTEAMEIIIVNAILLLSSLFPLFDSICSLVAAILTASNVQFTCKQHYRNDITNFMEL